MCFSMAWIEQLCIWLIMVISVVAIIRLLVPYLTGLIGVPIVAQIINIVLWAVVAIMCVYIIFALIGCLLGGGGILHFPTGR
jgi:hypothetical protein